MSKSLEWRHMAARSSLRWRRHCRRRRRCCCCDGLACCCVGGGGHKLRGRDVIEKHNWRKKKERALHCAIFCSPFLPALHVYFLLLLLLLSFSAIFFAAAFTEICSAQKSLPFFGKMWQFMRSCRGVSEPECCRRRRRSVRCGPIAAFLLTKGAMPKALGPLKRRNGRDQGTSRVHQECEKVKIKLTLDIITVVCTCLSLPCLAPAPPFVGCRLPPSYVLSYTYTALNLMRQN